MVQNNLDPHIFVKLACIPNFSFLGELEVTFPGGWVGCGGYLVGGWLETDNRAISVQSNLTGTATGTELGNLIKFGDFCASLLRLYFLSLENFVKLQS